MKTLFSRVFSLHALGLIIILNSCAPAYVPNVVNAPMLHNGGEINANVGIGTNGLDPQIAFGLSDHIGLMVNGSISYPNNDSSHIHRFVEVGTGFYGGSNDVIFEIYGGYGVGYVESTFQGGIVFENKYTDANYQRIFIQPGVGTTTKIIDFSFNPRLVFVEMDIKDPDFTISSSYDLFIEPTFTIRLGFRNVKFYSQMGFSIPLDEENLHYDIRWFMFSTGLSLNFGRISY